MFGGDTLTATDVAVAAGIAPRSATRRGSRTSTARWCARAWTRIADAHRRGRRPHAHDRRRRCRWSWSAAARSCVPETLDERVGACAGRSTSRWRTRSAPRSRQVGGEVDRVFALERVGREEVAGRRQAGGGRQGGRGGRARRRRCEIVDVDEVPLAYLPGNATRIRVKAVGELQLGSASMRQIGVTELATSRAAPRCSAPAAAATRTSASCWREQSIREHGPVTLVERRRGARRRAGRAVGDDGRADRDGGEAARRAASRRSPCGRWESSSAGRSRTPCSIEAGGLNSTIPFVAAAELGLPVVDADGMGRAFPEVQMVLCHAGRRSSATPMALADEKGNSLVMRTIDNRWAERFARSATDRDGRARR